MELIVMFNLMIPGLQRDYHRQRGDDLQHHLPEEHRGDPRAKHCHRARSSQPTEVPGLRYKVPRLPC